MNAQAFNELISAASREEIERLQSVLRSRFDGRVRDLHLRLEDPGLVLEGCAHSYFAKQLAQQAVMTATTLPIAANEIEVS
jgi:hypothetical protein